jgi:transcriptional regulator with XRE-family HTH domain
MKISQPMEQIGKEIAKARSKAGLTQEQLGEEIAEARRRAGILPTDPRESKGVSRQTIGLYERGRIPPPFETLATIASVLGADQFVVEDLHVTFNRNGAKTVSEAVPQQLELDFDENGGVTVRIEPGPHGMRIKAVSA